MPKKLPKFKYLVRMDNDEFSRVRKINDKYLYFSLKILITIFKN